MLTFEQIKELVELIATRGLHGMEVERSGFRLKIEGQAPVAPPAVGTALVARAHANPTESAASALVTPPALEQVQATTVSSGPADHVLTSPIVGTFYRSSSPEASPFTEVGAQVKKGQVLCIIEAMKLMNEIESDQNGVVTQVHPQNAQAVEFGQPLFSIRAN